MLSEAGLVGAIVVVTGVGSKVAGAAWSVAMRGNVLFVLAIGDDVSLVAATGLTAGAAPKTGWFCWAASFCLASGDRAW